MRAFLRFIGSLALVAAMALAVYLTFFVNTSVSVGADAVPGATFPGQVPGEINNIGLIGEQISGLLFCIVLAIFGATCVLVGQRWQREEGDKAPSRPQKDKILV